MKKIAFMFVWLSFYSAGLCAAPNQNFNIPASEKLVITNTLEKLGKESGHNLPIDDLQPTPIKGIYQITSDVNVFYITSDGKYLILGELLDTSKDKKNWSLTEQTARKIRAIMLAKIDVKDMIVFPATAKKIGTVTVFTDIDCQYCHKLQENIKNYTDAGIEIRYLAFPRSGPDSPSFEKAISVWCSKDRPKDYALAIAGKEILKNQCAKNPVAMEFELGQKMGVNGTPTMILENGMKFGGLVDPKILVKAIKNEL